MDLQNVLTSAELKRRGIAAIEQALQHGPVHLLKRNRSAAVLIDWVAEQEAFGFIKLSCELPAHSGKRHSSSLKYSGSTVVWD